MYTLGNHHQRNGGFQNIVIRQRAGAIMPLLAVVTVALLIVAALTINSNWLMYNQINAQNTADLSARGSLSKILSDTEIEGRVDRARAIGVRLYGLNIDRDNNEIAPDRVRFGTIANANSLDPAFNEVFDEEDSITAVHIDSPVEIEQQEVKVFFANMMGRETVPIFADAKVSTRPVEMMLCLDASRSMNTTSSGTPKFPPGANSIHQKPLAGSRFFELKDTVAAFLFAMRDANPNARIGLVTFGGGIGLDSRPSSGSKLVSPLDADWARSERPLRAAISTQTGLINDVLNRYVDEYPALGLGTSLYDGIQVSLDALSNESASRHIVMLSDGNQVAKGRPAALVAAQAASAAGVTIHTISFGGNFGQMTAISNETGGSNFTALNEEELREAFGSLLGRFRTQLVD